MEMRLATQGEEKEREWRENQLIEKADWYMYVCKTTQLYDFISYLVKYIYYINLETVDGKNYEDETS